MIDFKRIIIIGTTNLLYKCEKMIKAKYPDVPVTVVDIGGGLKNKNSDVKILSKSEIMDLLENIDDKTLVFSVMNKYLFPERVVDNEFLTMINLHHAYLPKHPGRNAEAWAIYEGDEKGGITWHLITNKVDHGNIILQKEIDILPTDTSLSLLQKYNQLALEGLNEILPLEKLNTASFIVQSGEEHPCVHYSYERPNNGVLDLNWDAKKMIRFLNSMNYGKMDVLGEMEVLYDNQKYFFKKYKIEMSDDNEEYILMDEENESMIIKKEKVFITLKKLKKEDNTSKK